MDCSGLKAWTPIVIAFLAGSIATALVPLAVPILKPISAEFGIDGTRLGWVISIPTLICAFGALALGILVDRMGDVRVLLAGMALTILGDIGVSLCANADQLFAARLFQGVGYVCLSVAGPAFIQRTTSADRRRAAMAFWAAHTPLGFAVAVLYGAHLVAAGLSWRLTFISHAVGALVIGGTVLLLRRVASASDASRSRGTREVLTSPRPYAVALGAGATALLQVSLMVMLPTLFNTRFGLSGTEAAMAVAGAMSANIGGAMLVVATDLRKHPRVGLPICAVLSSLFALAVLARAGADFAQALALVVLFSTAIGAANSLVWSLIPAAVPFPEASGATAGLITQGSFLGVLVGPPLFFWLLHANPSALYLVVAGLVALMILPLVAVSGAGGSKSGAASRPGRPAGA
ncbi:MFS transporter [Novosphingobium flavum]|uniref:MFS transporter n=1 Tax=Novosphingobium flavum TaxID=1778672 RepID=A0A7X1KL76_9SPHN|nr:MFS transporter [Novosphingobium flavum]MBC2665294.1 MFS transporter [Novosphingobium flavum]